MEAKGEPSQRKKAEEKGERGGPAGGGEGSHSSHVLMGRDGSAILPKLLVT